MVLGFLRRRRGGGSPAQGSRAGPKGQMTPEGYIPTPEELQIAEPLPHVVDGWVPPEHGVSEEEYGWVLLNRDTWKPCMKAGVSGRALKDPIKVGAYEYEAMEWGPDGKIYLADGITHALLAETYNCDKTAREIVESLIEETVEMLPEDNPWKKAFVTGEADEQVKKEIKGMIAAYYRQLALLRNRGLIE